MKKMLALGAMAVVLGLGLEGAPALAVATAETSGVSAQASTTSATDVAAAVARAEEAIAKTDTTTVNAKEVAAMREYLQGWVAQAKVLDLAQLTAGQVKELIAALDEGARGLRLTAGVDRKVATEASNAGATTSTANGTEASTVNGSVAEPRTAKESTSATKAKEVAKTAETVKNVEVADGSDAKADLKDGAEDVALASASTKDMSALVTLATAQVKKPTVASAAVVAENAEADVPKTGASNEEEQTSTAVRGMGLVLGGAVVLAAAAGAVLIVKRMKRGL